MKCHVCGASLQSVVTDLPFKINEKTIVILKKLPVLQCANCADYQLEDDTMRQVELILEGVDADVELEIIDYAA